MRRFFIPSANILDKTAWMEGSDVNHLHNVLRKDVGDTLEATDGAGNILQVKISAVSDSRIDFVILSTRPQVGLGINIRVFQAIPRGTSMEMLIEKLSELGVSTIYPLMTERTIPCYQGDKALKKQARWQKIADETAKKMGSGPAVVVQTTISFRDMPLYDQKYTLKVLAWEVEQSTSLKQYLQAHREYDNIDLIIGPEGGFTQKEIDSLLTWGYQAVSLGPRVLKVATASIVMVSNIIYEWALD